MKQCSKCKQMRDELEFNNRSLSGDGLNCQCKVCCSKYGKEYHRKHREEKVRYDKTYYKTHKEEKLAISKKWHEENPEARGKHHKKANKKWQKSNPKKIAEFDKRYYEGHKEEILARVEIWREENPEKYKKIKIRAYTKRERNLGWILLYPNPFDKCEIIHWHHPNDEYVVALPRDLHQLGGIYSGNNKETHRESLSYIVNQIYGGV